MSEQPQRKERTIRSETTKVFLVIFFILVTLGAFTIYSTIRGANTFDDIKEKHLHKFLAVEKIKQKGLDITALYYLMATDHNIDLLMDQLGRFDEMIKEINDAVDQLKTSLTSEGQDDTAKKQLATIEETLQTFEDLNNNARQMTFAMMEGDKKKAGQFFNVVNTNVAVFKTQLDNLEKSIADQLLDEASKAQTLLSRTTIAGLIITLLSILITLGLIYYLMKFLSISLLPISNLMHNMRQAVFSVNEKYEVISPVSAYSKEVFGEDIVGKSLDEVVYKDTDPNSEAFASCKSALMSVFGEGELQWMLAEDTLMPQVNRVITTSMGDENEKVLKLTYTPLWDEKTETLKSIMIVAEDVTEIEKLRLENVLNQEEMSIIQGLVSMDKETLEEYFGDAQGKMEESRSLLPKLQNDLESRQLLFRILHTLKGNSRMYNMNMVSQSVHEVENNVVQMNEVLAGGGELEATTIPELAEGFDRIESVLARHTRMAEKIFGIHDRYATKMEEQMYRSFSALEIALEHSELSDSLSSKKLSFAEVHPRLASFVLTKERAVDLAIEAAQYFEMDDLLDKLKSAKEKLVEGQQLDKEQLQMIYREVSETCFRKGAFRPYNFDLEKWLSSLLSLYELSELVVKHKNNLSENSIINRAMELFDTFDTHRFIYLRRQMAEFLFLIDLEENELALTSLSKAWSYVAGLFSEDASITMTMDQRFQLAQSITGDLEKSDGLNDSLSKVGGSQVFGMSFLRALGRKGVGLASLQSTLGVFLETTEIGKTFDLMFGSKDGKEFFNTLLDILCGQSNLSMNGGEIIDQAKSANLTAFVSRFEKGFLGGVWRIDQLQILMTLLKTGYMDERERQMIAIPAQQFNEIKAVTMQLSPDSPENFKKSLAKLQYAVKHALDFPLKAVCSKLEPMVKDLAKRLEKDVVFKISGENVSLNRDATYSLRDALVHILRNSLDHGIESPDERSSVGKPPRATLEIELGQKDNKVLMAIRDDGKGIDVEKVVKKAISSKIITEEKASSMTDQEKLNLIFTPNLSTKEQVTSLSGRGVGMDAVKEKIKELGGNVTLKSELGKGTELNLTLLND